VLPSHIPRTTTVEKIDEENEINETSFNESIHNKINNDKR
jgi:hypothetical protein